MILNDRIKAFISLGKFLMQFGESSDKADHPINQLYYDSFAQLIKTAHHSNGWFTEDNVRNAINQIALSLNESELLEWVAIYINKLSEPSSPKTVGIVMAGNIPLVGFNDFLCVLLSGNKALIKTSSNDHVLLPAIAEVLSSIEPRFNDQIEFAENKLPPVDALIATGSDNTARHFEYYFKKHPKIIRHNRNSVGVLTGMEKEEELAELGKDIFQYFGLGCRNISKLYVPSNYNFNSFFTSIYKYKDVINNNKYGNNYEYNRTVFLMSKENKMLDNNFLILKEDSNINSPIGVLFFEYYEDINMVNEQLSRQKQLIQCVVSSSEKIQDALPFGQAQCPSLNDYADGIDTILFLTSL